MEEQILKMIIHHSVSTCKDNNCGWILPADFYDTLSKDITSHFTKFIKWKDDECSYDGTDQTYYLPDIQKWISLMIFTTIG